jgi:biopolymer transport protein TolR
MSHFPAPFKKGNRRSFRPETSINIAPLVDVMLVLLIVFMVTAPMLTVGVPVDLPKTNAAQMNDQSDPIVVTVNAEGVLFLQEMPIPLTELSTRLLAVTKNNKDIKIFVRGDQKLAYGKVMETMGAIAEAGFKKVSLIAEMPAGNKMTSKPVQLKKIR